MEIEIGGIEASYCLSGEKAVLLCPPHPLMGGNRFDVRLVRISEELNKLGFSTLSFDYKGYRNGIGEIEDAKTCIEFLKSRHSNVSVLGYSFGSVVASNVANICNSAIFISPLPSIGSIVFKDANVPKLFIIAKKDQFLPLSESLDLFFKLSEPKDFVILDTDHFYSGKFDILAKKVCEFLNIERK
ncbi:MAG: alpha/beta hydrolase [Archaeoglobales archaeon]|jgi:alpha/beta superfamily hydrolase|nr:alpha/beta hydrolase [Archaeoglobus sp.]NHW89393.1 alpha/beta hydrolase [Archaeoglobales archaeon]